MATTRKFRWTLLAIAMIVAAIGFVAARERAKEDAAIFMIVGDGDKPGLLKTNMSLGKVAGAQYQHYRTNSVMWSGVYHGAVFFSALLSVLATLILKLETWPENWDDKKRKDYAAVFAAMGALMITVSTAGDFQAKWEANRMAAAKSAALVFELLKKESGAIPLEVVTNMQAIILAQNQAVISENHRAALGPQSPGATPVTSDPAK